MADASPTHINNSKYVLKIFGVFGVIGKGKNV